MWAKYAKTIASPAHLAREETFSGPCDGMGNQRDAGLGFSMKGSKVGWSSPFE